MSDVSSSSSLPSRPPASGAFGAAGLDAGPPARPPGAGPAPRYRRIELIGGPEELGRRQADLLAPYLPTRRRWAWEREPGFLAACARTLRAVHEPLWEELCSYAAARGLPEEEGLFLRAHAWPHGCSSFAWRLPDGRVVAGRNYDFLARSLTRDLLRTRPLRGLAHVGMCGGLVGGRYDGLNEAGLFAALHKVMADRAPRIAPGIPYHLVPRLALELADTATRAARLVASLPQLAPFTYLVADAGGTFVALECYPGEPVRARRSRRALAVTNHYRHRDLAPLQGRRPLDHSRARAERLGRLPLANGGESDGLAAAAAALRDHEAGVCNHGEMNATLWSAIADLGTRRIAYAFGPPCRVDYVEHEIPRG